MKSYNHLYEEFISEDTIRYAISKSSIGKRTRFFVRDVFNNPDDWIPALKEYAQNFKNRAHKPKVIYDGISRKKREIIVPRYDEQVIHHMVVATMMPIFKKGMYEHTYGSIPGRGVHKAKKAVCSWLRKKKDTKYFLKMDIKKFFPSIPHEILKRKLAEIIHDERFLKVVYEIVDVQPVGLPLGFYTSQWLANWYLQDLDHFIKEKLGAEHYIRYMDDMVVFGSNKRILHRTRIQIEAFLKEQLGLEMKENWCVARFIYEKGEQERGRFLDFMGFRFYRNRTTLRKSLMLKAVRKALTLHRKKRKTVHDARQMLSYCGWFFHRDVYKVFKNWILNNVNIRYLKSKIGKSDKNRRVVCGKATATVTP